MEPELSAERRIAQKMTDLDITAEFLGQLTATCGFRGLPQPRISQALRGTKDFSNEQASFLLKLLERLENLRDELSPVEPAFKNPARTKALLDDLDSRSLVLVVLSGLQPDEQS